jgi:effector-binding domain-containing protein
VSYTVEVKKLERQPVLDIHRDVPVADIPQVMQQAIPAVFAYAGSHGGVPKFVYARYYDVRPEQVSMDVGVIIATAIDGEGEVKADHLPAGDAACVLHVGPYEAMEPAYGAVESWMKANGREASGAPWEIYLSDPQSEPDPQKWRTEICWPLK